MDADRENRRADRKAFKEMTERRESERKAYEEKREAERKPAEEKWRQGWKTFTTRQEPTT
jgi:hypothetical protein